MLRVQGDQEGIISAQKIDLHSLPTDILEAFSPLLCEMEELSTTLNLEEFLDASYRLYNVRTSFHNILQTLNIHEKNLILNFKKKQQRLKDFTTSQCTF